MTDNEWAAEWLGFGLGHTIYGREYAPDRAVDGPGEDGKYDCTLKPLPGGSRDLDRWQPDKDLNQFKLVLDKMDTWLENFAPITSQYHRGQAVFESMDYTAWSNPAEALKRIREAVENGQ